MASIALAIATAGIMVILGARTDANRALRIVDGNGDVLTLVAKDGTTFRFDAAKLAFVSP
jgi:hypothetical protein